jgi:hypothetical protein
LNDDEDDEQLPTDPREVVEYIRRTEYGVGANLTGEGARTVRNLTRKYGKLLSTIANELNSEDNHFLLELIQNAQDNKYGEGTEPSILFRATPELLIVENNELGFTAQNVKSLCSAAESTKTDKTMYIGEKGIGFKSVFKVTHAPEVHSNGFHFRFLRDPTEKGGLSYILPHWHEPTFEVRQHGTTLVLPAKEGYSFGDFHQLSPTLLLFLSKLRLISIERDGVLTSFRCLDDAGVTRLTASTRTGNTEDVVEKRFVRASSTVSMASITEERRKGVPESTLVLAFPVLATRSPELGATCPLFAFLPVYDYGFRFIIHADFVLTSSRESIQEQLPWNQRLRDCIPNAFLAALERFKADPTLRNAYFQFLPRKGEVKGDFFKTVRSKLFAALGETECVLGQSGRWLKPKQVLLASKEFRELVPSATVLELFGLDYPDPAVDAPPELLQEIGCQPLLIEQVCTFFSTHATWFAKRPLAWRASFYAYLANISNRDVLVRSLLQVTCIPLSSGKLVVPGSATIFFPLRADKEYGFEHELSVLQPSIFSKALKANPNTEALFVALGVKHDEPYDVIHFHILPKHQDPHLEGSTDDALIAHLRYVKDRWNEYKSALALRGAQSLSIGQLSVGTKAKMADGWIFDQPAKLYVSKEYSPLFSLEEIGGGEVDAGLLVSERYVTEDEAASNESLQEWQTFFRELGVNVRPRVMRTSDGDARCGPEIHNLLSSPKKTVRRLLLEAFARDWNIYAEFTRSSVTLGRAYTARATTFLEELRGTTAPTKRRNAFRLDASYFDCEEVRSFFGENANYLDARISNLDFLKTCGVTHRVDAPACMRRLREARAGAILSRQQLRHIFNRLEECWRQDQAAIEQAFKSEALIPVNSGEDVQWFTSGQVTWRSPPMQVRVLERLAPSLSNKYQEHLQFFTRLLRIQNELPLTKWVDAIALLPTVDDVAERRRSAIGIYQRLSTELEKRDQGDSSAQLGPWLHRFSGERLFLTRKGTLVANSPKLFRGDLPELVKLFEDATALSFLDIPADQLPKLAVLLKEVGVRSLADSVVWRVAPDTVGALHPSLTEKVRSAVPLIARLVYSSGHSRFKAAIEAGQFQRAQRLSVLNVKSLDIDATLAGHVRRTSGDAALEGDSLYLRVGAPAALDQVARELRTLFGLPESAADTITRLLLCNSAAEADEYLGIVKRIGVLPDEEERHFRTGALLMEEELGEDADSDEGNSATAVLDDSKAPIHSGRETSGSVDAPAAPPEQELPIPRLKPGADAAPQLPPKAVDGQSVPQELGGVGRNLSAVPDSNRGADSAASPRPIITNPPESTNSGHEPAHEVPATGAHRTSELDPLQRLKEAADAAPVTDGALKWEVKQHSGQPGSKSGASSKRRLKRRAGRMVSYAEPPEALRPESEEEQRAKQERKDAVEVAAVRCVMSSAEVLARWPKLTEMPPLNPGFDILAETAEGKTEFIEVKGRSADWGLDGVSLTPTELEKASKEGDRYWLCVVENALSASPRLYLVQAPYVKTDHFCFDSNWKSKAVAASTALTKPAAGLYVTVPGKGKGRIISVKGTSTMSRVHIIYGDGSQSFKLFEPGKMVLSRE